MQERAKLRRSPIGQRKEAILPQPSRAAAAGEAAPLSNCAPRTLSRTTNTSEASEGPWGSSSPSAHAKKMLQEWPQSSRGPLGAGVASRAGQASRRAAASRTLSLGHDFDSTVGLNPGTTVLKHQHRPATLPAPRAAAAGLVEGVSKLGEAGTSPPPPAVSIHLQPRKSLSRCFCCSPLRSPPPWGLGPAPTSGSTGPSAAQMNADALLGQQCCPPGWVLAGTSWVHSCPEMSPLPCWSFHGHAHQRCSATSLTRRGCFWGWVLLGMGIISRDGCSWA